MKIYNAKEMRAAEQAAVDKGTSFEQLMENAGRLRQRIFCSIVSVGKKY